MIDATAGRDDVLPSATSARTGDGGSLDPAWRGVWQSAMERTQVQSWFHATPDTGAVSSEANQTPMQGDDGTRAKPAPVTPFVESDNVARHTVVLSRNVPPMPAATYVDLRGGVTPAKTTFGDTAYANPSPGSGAMQGGAGQGAMVSATFAASTTFTDATARVQNLLREAFVAQEIPVRWHVSLSESVANVWLGVSASHADMARALIPALRDAMRREGIQVGTMTVNGVVVPMQEDAAPLAQPQSAHAAPRR